MTTPPRVEVLPIAKGATPDLGNVNKHTQRGSGLLENELRKRGAFRSIASAGKDTDVPVVYAGNLTLEKAVEAGFTEIVNVHVRGDQLVNVVRDDLAPGSAEAIALGISDNEIGKQSYSPDIDILAALAAGDSAILSALKQDDKVFAGMLEGMGLKEEAKDAPVDTSQAEAMRQKYGTELGQTWAIGEHRLFIGDSGNTREVARFMDGKKAVLVHADPPYGMGKESEGIANDNLYKEKLDLFQMAWWKACRPHVEDNGSAYIWGTADDLWRLWYCGGLRDSERLTMRNEIIWEKQGAQGIGSEAHRQYPTASERCLFFMLGEQKYEEWWDGWTPIRDYFIEEKRKSGLTNKEINQILGTSDKGGGMASHYFTGDEKGEKKQWTLPTKEMYQKLQASSDAFKREYDELKREYDELKREFYSTRAHFDNTHDNMTDVWHFPRVTGDERMGHATPKPVEMMERVIKSSSPVWGLVYVPFLGTAPEMVACQKLERVCYGVDVDAGYAALAIHRMSVAFPALAIRKLE